MFDFNVGISEVDFQIHLDSLNESVREEFGFSENDDGGEHLT